MAHDVAYVDALHTQLILSSDPVAGHIVLRVAYIKIKVLHHGCALLRSLALEVDALKDGYVKQYGKRLIGDRRNADGNMDDGSL